MEFHFKVPPGWPIPPEGWLPPEGWTPDVSWPAAPAGWQFWVTTDEAGAGPQSVKAGTSASASTKVREPRPPVSSDGFPLVSAPAPEESTSDSESVRAGGRFGARRRLARVEKQDAQLRIRNAQLEGSVRELEQRVAQLRGMDAIAREAVLDRSRAELAGLQQRVIATQQQIAAERADTDRDIAQVRQRIDEATAQLATVQRQIVQTAETSLLQEVGVYEYQHPLSDAVAYKARLSRLNDDIKSMTRSGTAVSAETEWVVRDSARQGRKMIREYSKLVLRAYNAEADNCVRTMRPHRLTSSVDRLTKARDVIARLGATMDIHIAEDYHQLRIEELELTGDYLAKVDEQKEQVRAEREQRREEAAAQKEFDREKARLQKEHAHYLAALARLQATGDATGTAELQDKLEEINNAITGVEEREANVRAGYVYVISNVGSFGEHMIKIGMTRRLEPLDRVRELGDASVPFRFDIHALIFSDDAVTLEGDLHAKLADRRVNQVNLRREFFYATPAEVHEVLDQVVGPHLLEYTEDHEALEWRASRRDREIDEK